MIGDKGLACLAKGIAREEQLRSLDLSNNRLTDEAVAAAFDAIQHAQVDLLKKNIGR